ncbi:MAG: pirin family protein [Bacteroidota bacterium]|nr:pirin family protein [Bacteroidota bacterium]
MPHIIHKSDNRGLKDIGWLQSRFSFSFSSYQNPVNNGFGLLIALNDDLVKKGGGFGLHPHTNMEIISVMLQGKMNHKDTMGYTEVVEKDWVQLMSAGTGLRHEEHNVGDEDVRFLQIWIEPKLQNITPRYQKRFFPKEKRKNRLQTIVSNEEGVQHCWINQNAKLSLGWFEKDQSLSYSVNPVNKCVYIFVLEGQLKIEDSTIYRRDAMGLWEKDNITITAQEEAEFIVIEVPINH